VTAGTPPLRSADCPRPSQREAETEFPGAWSRRGKILLPALLRRMSGRCRSDPPVPREPLVIQFHAFIDSFIHFLKAPSTEFKRAEILILNYRKYVWDGHDAGSEIANVSGWQAAFISRAQTVQQHTWHKGWSKKTDTQFYFWDNFGNSAPILTILSLLQAEI